MLHDLKTIQSEKAAWGYPYTLEREHFIALLEMISHHEHKWAPLCQVYELRANGNTHKYPEWMGYGEFLLIIVLLRLTVFEVEGGCCELDHLLVLT